MALVAATFEDLTESLEGRRRLGEDPPVLLLGAGASATAGLATMRRLYEVEGIPPEAPDAFERFCERMRKRDDRERFRWLAAHLQTADPQVVTPGYRALASLCAQHVFDIVLTANLDPLLEDAFAATSLKRRDYLVLINGVLRKERLPLLLLPGAPRVKVLKIHGDLFHRFMAWTPEEMDEYLREITPVLSKSLAYRDVLVVGYSMRDPAVRELALGFGGSVWFANPSPPADEIREELSARGVRVITSPRCRFEEFFSGVAAALKVEVAGSPVPAEGLVVGAAPSPLTPPLPSAPGATSGRQTGGRTGRQRPLSVAAGSAPAPTPTPTGPDIRPVSASARVETADNLDEVLAATVGFVAGGDPGYVAYTGFLLSEPRWIVTDGWVARQFGAGRGTKATIVTQSGERFIVRPLGSVDGNPFAPAIFEPPASWQVAGLRWDGSDLGAGQAVDVSVATSLRRAIREGAMSVDDALAQRLIDDEAAAELRKALTRSKRGRRGGSGNSAGASDPEWQRFSIARGSVVSGAEESLTVAPIGRVDDLVRLKLATGPGSSGGPVVDRLCGVRGYIVAGSTDPKRPDSYMLPAGWWGDRLARVTR